VTTVVVVLVVVAVWKSAEDNGGLANVAALCLKCCLKLGYVSIDGFLMSISKFYNSSHRSHAAHASNTALVLNGILYKDDVLVYNVFHCSSILEVLQVLLLFV